MVSPAVSPDLSAFLQRLSSAGTDVFADAFLSLDPLRAMVVTRKQLTAALPQRRALFAAAGVRNTRLQSLDARPLDDLHQLAETTWATEFDDPATEPLTLRSTFLVRRQGGSWSVLVYLNHHDIAAELTRRAAG